MSTLSCCSTKLGTISVQPVPTVGKTATNATKTYTAKSTTTPVVTVKTGTTTLRQAISTTTKTISTRTTTTTTSVTATQTITSTSTYGQYDTTSTVTTDTTITNTETVLAPGPTYYAAYSSDNLATNANGGYTISDIGISGSNYYTDASSPYDCYAAYQASNCKDSLYFADAYPSPVCFNSYGDTCTPTSVTDYFYTYSDQQSGYVVNNGPCGLVQNGDNYPSDY